MKNNKFIIFRIFYFVVLILFLGLNSYMVYEFIINNGQSMLYIHLLGTGIIIIAILGQIIAIIKALITKNESLLIHDIAFHENESINTLSLKIISVVFGVTLILTALLTVLRFFNLDFPYNYDVGLLLASYAAINSLFFIIYVAVFKKKKVEQGELDSEKTNKK